MHTTNTLILGAGQAGLALSHWLTVLGRDHLILERGQVAERWHGERWDSLRLLTPNWMARLPGWSYDGPNPDGFMTAAEVASYFDRYATSFAAPVHEHTTVHRLAADGEGFVVGTDGGEYRSSNVVIATGWCDRPAIPAASRHVSPRIHQVIPSEYRNPADVPPGGVLVVGASATGVQLADELHRDGRHVTLAVGSHSRLPRRYRGLDIYWWLSSIGAFDKTIDDVGDVVAARSEPSTQLVGRPDHTTIDLPTLQAQGVDLAGRLLGADGTRVFVGTDAGAVVDAADRRMRRVLARIDHAIERLGLTSEVLDAEPLPAVSPISAPDELDLRDAGINTVVWATGHRRRYEWLQLPILDGRGEIRQYRGVTPQPGAYVLGQRFQHYRNSNFIDGVGRDARFVAEQICRTNAAVDASPPAPSRRRSEVEHALR
jgi:putative flavoprotein involved in K+ transport